MKESIGQRIKELRKKLGLSQEEFGKKLGVTLRTIARYERGETSIPDRTLRQIEQTFNVNPEWLRHGRGEMFKPKPKSNLKFLGAVPFDFVLLPIPVLSEARAGRGFFAEIENPQEVRLVWTPKKYADHRLFFFRVSGNSMRPRLQDGDWVVADLDSSVVNGDLAVVELSNGEIMVKKWRKKRGNILLLESYNPDEEPIVISPEEVKTVAKVVLIVPNGESPWG